MKRWGVPTKLHSSPCANSSQQFNSGVKGHRLSTGQRLGHVRPLNRHWFRCRKAVSLGEEAASTLQCLEDRQKAAGISRGASPMPGQWPKWCQIRSSSSMLWHGIFTCLVPRDALWGKYNCESDWAGHWSLFPTISWGHFLWLSSWKLRCHGQGASASWIIRDDHTSGYLVLIGTGTKTHLRCQQDGRSGKKWREIVYSRRWMRIRGAHNMPSRFCRSCTNPSEVVPHGL